MEGKISRNRFYYLIIAIILLLSLVSYFLFTGNNKKIEYNCTQKDQACQIKYIDQYFKNNTTINTLKNLVILNNERKTVTCHDLAHRIGENSYERYRKNKNTQYYFKDLTYLCSSGYLHGLLQEAGKAKDLNFISNISEITCRGEKGKINQDYQIASCLHAVGHSFYQAELPLNYALKQCSSLSENYNGSQSKEQISYLKYRCDSGFAMESLDHVSAKNPAITSIAKVREICSESGDIYCNLAYMRNLTENSALPNEELVRRSKEMHEYCLTITESTEAKICEVNIGSALVTYFKEVPTAEKLAIYANKICNTKACIEVALQVNSTRNIKSTPAYSEKLCTLLKIIEKNFCINELNRNNKEYTL